MPVNSKKIKPLLNQLIQAGVINLSGPREGDVIETELIKKTSREAYFDVGSFGTGILYGLEFLNAKNIIRNLKVGDRIPAKITSLDNSSDYVELSLSEAEKQQVWSQIKELQESGEIIKAKVVSMNSGGLTLNLLSLKAFLPISQLSSDHQPKVADGDRDKLLEELKKLIGEELNVKIIDLNPRSNKLIVSEREGVGINVKELLAEYQIGQEVDGLISGIADFGVFVRFIDNPGLEGMVHISELDHRLVDNPKEIVKLNDTVRVKIIDIKNNRVFLSLKALKTDPWERVAERYEVGQEVKGFVYKFNPFGAVINLDGQIQGMIHISKFGGLEEMKKELLPDQEYRFIVESLNPGEKRLTLNIEK